MLENVQDETELEPVVESATNVKQIDPNPSVPDTTTKESDLTRASSDTSDSERESVEKETAPPETTETFATETFTIETFSTETFTTETFIAEAPTTEPATTEPAPIEPAVTEPAVAEHPATEVATTEPVVTKPVVTKPAVTKPAVTKPAVTKPAVTKPAAAEPPIIEVPAPDNPTAAEPSTREADIAEISAKSNGSQPKPQSPADTGNQPTNEDIRFKDLELSGNVQKAVTAAGYDSPTAIQAEIIPHVLAGRDILAQSQTGTGKTAAFAMPILSRIKPRSKKPQILVLTPTRELAIQVASSFTSYGASVPDLGVLSIYGGQDYEIQFRQLRKGVQVVVGTPGRVIDHIKRGTLDLSEIETLVLDEADEMLNMGFLEDVEFVLKHTPERRQVALFSATLPKPIRDISERYLNDPAKITIKRKTMTADSIHQRAVFVAPRDKIDLLARFLETEETDGVIVFTRTREATSTVAEQLNRHGLQAVALNGDMPQKTRERTIQRLKAGQLNILVATDVAARGLDVPRISHVFNYDLPEGAESYTHRVGRTGRAGRAGEAIIFLTKGQRGKLRMIEKATRQTIEIVDGPSTEQINEMRVKRFKESISKTVKKSNLSFLRQLINDYAEESGQPVDVIAAAIAQLGNNGRGFLMTDRPKSDQRHEQKFEKREGSPRNTRGKRSSSDQAETGMVRYRLAVGKFDGVRAGNIVGAVANEAGMDGSNIGPIRIHDTYSTIDLPQDLPQEMLEILRHARVSGRQLKMRPWRDEPDRGDAGSRNRKGRPNDGQKTYGGKARANRAFSKAKSTGKPKNKKWKKKTTAG